MRDATAGLNKKSNGLILINIIIYIYYNEIQQFQSETALQAARKLAGVCGPAFHPI